MFEPLLIIDKKIKSNLKYMLYSGHDENISNSLMIFMPSIQFENIPYASSIYLELYDIFGVWYV